MLESSWEGPMATLYVENFPDDVYAALRKRAKQQGRSISAEVIALLKDAVPTAKELARRKRLLVRVMEIRSRPPLGPGPASTEMLREDRSR